MSRAGEAVFGKLVGINAPFSGGWIRSTETRPGLPTTSQVMLGRSSLPEPRGFEVVPAAPGFL